MEAAGENLNGGHPPHPYRERPCPANRPSLIGENAPRAGAGTGSPARSPGDSVFHATRLLSVRVGPSLSPSEVSISDTRHGLGS